MAFKLGKWVVVAVAVLASTAASAAPLALWVGQTEMLGTQRKIKTITVSNPEVVSVEKQKSGAELRAKAPGVSHVEMRTTDGYVFEFEVHVTAGAEVYSTNRKESEHADFTLEGTKAPEKAAKAKEKTAAAVTK
jgi:Flp pilus assembly secretin CpaC